MLSNRFEQSQIELNDIETIKFESYRIDYNQKQSNLIEQNQLQLNKI